MQLKRTISTIVLVGSGIASLFGQAETAVVQGYIGPSIFPASSQHDLLAGFRPGFTVGGGIAKTIKHSLVYNPNLEFTASSKEHFTFSLLSIDNNLKYYPWWLKKVRPYAMLIANVSFMNLHQQAYSTMVNPDASYSGTDPSNIPVSQVIYREPDLKLQFAPTFGLGAGLGIDFTLRLKFVPFIQYSYVSYFSKSSTLINNNFKNNTKNLASQNIILGARFNVFKSIAK